MSKYQIQRAEERGHANHGWLNAYHSFSFSSYYNPEKVHFGTLRVLNDDTVAAGMGFGTHPHENMEIITILLSGELQHRDSMGNVGILHKNDVQVMSAGTGIMHSEINHSKTEELKLLQIWVFPHVKQVTPRYDQITLDSKKLNNQFCQIVSPSPDDEGMWIHQNAWFHMGNFDSNQSFDYIMKASENGLYIFIISGSFIVDGHELNSRDAIAIENLSQIHISSKETGQILLMEVPMQI